VFVVLSFGAAEPLSYSRRDVAGVRLHVVAADLNDPRVVVSPALASGGVGRDERFSQFIQRLRPQAAITGTYFDKGTRRPVGDIVIDGHLVHFGGMGTAIAFGEEGVDCIRLPKSRHVDWSEHRAAVAGGPLLVWGGFAKPFPGGEGFGDPHVFARSAPRAAVGVTADNHLLLVVTVTGTSLTRLAVAMRDLGAVYALNMDGGASTGLWYEGGTIRAPGRRLTNVLCVYVRPEAVGERSLRAPQGLDWRAGHRARTVLAFSAEGVRISALLPRQWEGRQSVRIECDGPLPEGHTVGVRLDERTVYLVGALPADVTLELDGLSDLRHSLWIGLLNEEGEAVGGGERIFRVGGLP